jgi:putative hemolysin
LATGITILVVLIFLSAFFSGIESAFVSLGEIDLIEIGRSSKKNRKILLKLLENKEKLLSTILIGNNAVNISATALNTVLAVHYAAKMGVSEEVAVTVSAVVLAIIILLFGEVSPKSIAISHNQKLSLLAAPIILVLSILLSPLSYFSDKIGKFMVFIFRGHDHNERQISESTVINVVSKGQEQGVIKETEKNLIKNVFLFDEREVYPVMTPRTAVFALKEDLILADVQDQLLEKQFSRVPIYADSIDNITGIINLKAVFRNLLKDRKDSKLKQLADKPLFVYETLSLSALLEKFKAEQTHMAVVVDEYGGMAGVVTLEDILEELVGEIYDEKDEASLIRKVGDEKWMISGRTDIITINKGISGEIELEGEFETLQGLIMSKLERLPIVGDVLYVNPHQLTVMKMRQNEIVSVIVEYQPKDEQDQTQEIN